MEEPNLFSLRELVPGHVLREAALWARDQADGWPHGTYSPNDLVTMFEKGYLKGWLSAQSNAEGEVK